MKHTDLKPIWVQVNTLQNAKDGRGRTLKGIGKLLDMLNQLDVTDCPDDVAAVLHDMAASTHRAMSAKLRKSDFYVWFALSRLNKLTVIAGDKLKHPKK